MFCPDWSALGVSIPLPEEVSCNFEHVYMMIMYRGGLLVFLHFSLYVAGGVFISVVA